MNDATIARSRRTRLEKMRAQLEMDRTSFLSHWRDLNDFVKPRRARFYTSDVNRGDRRSNKIIDSTATFALRTLSSGMMAGITSPARPWFRLTVPQPEIRKIKPVQDWLHAVTEDMLATMQQTNIYNVLPILYSDMGLFATGAIGLFEDDEDGLRCQSFPVGSYMISNNQKGVVDVFFREFRMSARQLIDRFGKRASEDADDDIDWTKFSRKIKKAWDDGHLEMMFDVCHVIEPNRDYRPSAMNRKYARYSSLYYEKGTPKEWGDDARWETYLEEKGYEQFPILVGRWELTGEDTYGTDCPGMTVLGDVKQLQLGEKRIMQAIEKMVSPPVGAPNQLRNTPISMLPGGVTYYDAQSEHQVVRPMYQVDPRIQELAGMQQEKRELIRRGFYEDIFLMLAASDRREITATEVEARSAEKLVVLGPMLEQLNKDVLSKVVDLTFFYMQRRGQIPKPPQELQGRPLQVDYISIVAQAQKQVAVPALEHFIGVVAQIAPVQPDVMDKINVDQWVDELADATGVSPKIIRSDDEVAPIRADRAKAQQAAQAAATAKDATAAASNLAGAPTGGTRNALTDLMAAASGGNPYARSAALPA